jgi:hypothetical protein
MQQSIEICSSYEQPLESVSYLTLPEEVNLGSALLSGSHFTTTSSSHDDDEYRSPSTAVTMYRGPSPPAAV